MQNLVTLDSEIQAVKYLCEKDKRLAKVIKMVGTIQYTPHSENAYAFMVHEIIEQMLSIKAGKKIYERLENLCLGEIIPERINNLSDEQIRSTGVANAKVGYIRNITSVFEDGTIDVEKMRALSDNDIIKLLTSIRGIGNWTAKMFLIFVLDRQDVLPFEDGAFIQVYRWMYKTDKCDRKSIEAKCKKWKPYSSVAARFCYKALDFGFTKEEFHLYK